MLGSQRIKLVPLSRLCRRLAVSLESGLDLLRVLEREAQNSLGPRFRTELSHVHDRIMQGRGLGESVAASNGYFPPLFCEMAEVGEQSGRLAEAFRHLADHYDHQLQMRRAFLASITWPAIQLVAALVVVGILILVFGAIDSPIDPLGLGLKGTEGFVVYLCVVGGVAVACFLLIRGMSRDAAWTRPLQAVVRRLPVLGSNLRTLALARMAWSLHLTLDTGMALKRALPLAFRSSRNATFTQHTDQVVQDVMMGHEMHEALARTGVFPHDFVDTIEVGENSGRLPESLGILSKQYQDQAQRALTALAVVAGFAVWALVAVVIIFMIFQIFMNAYLGPINDALEFTR